MKKSTSASKTGLSFKSGDLVFAKVKGHPAWPAWVTNPAGEKGLKYHVLFFGTYETAVVPKDKIWIYNQANKEKYGKQLRKGFSEAIVEIERKPAIMLPQLSPEHEARKPKATPSKVEKRSKKANESKCLNRSSIINQDGGYVCSICPSSTKNNISLHRSSRSVRLHRRQTIHKKNQKSFARSTNHQPKTMEIRIYVKKLSDSYLRKLEQIQQILKTHLKENSPSIEHDLIEINGCYGHESINLRNDRTSNINLEDMPARSKIAEDDPEMLHEVDPEWACNEQLDSMLLKQGTKSPDLIFRFPETTLDSADLKDIFSKNLRIVKAGLHKRTSSAVWDKSLLGPYLKSY